VSSNRHARAQTLSNLAGPTPRTPLTDPLRIVVRHAAPSIQFDTPLHTAPTPTHPGPTETRGPRPLQRRQLGPASAGFRSDAKQLPTSVPLLVRTTSEVGVEEGGCSAPRATARCACRSPRIRPAASTPAAPATAAKQVRGPVAHDAGVAGEATGCASGDEQVPRHRRAGTRFHARAYIGVRNGFVTACVR
jgi:hypothetical protein